MGNQKLKWTAEEEEALRAGIEKHGAGKWKNILKDPEFSDQLSNRSNIDLKDKWRNLSVAPGTLASINKARPIKIKDEIVVVPPVPNADTDTPPLNANRLPSPPVPLKRDLSIDDVCNIVVDTRNGNAPRYDAVIFEAITTLAEANGSDVGSIFNYIEPRHKVSSTFRRFLSSRLRRLAAQGKLKVNNLKPQSQNYYKIADPSGTRTPSPAPKPKETNVKPRQTINQPPVVSQVMIEEAAITAAYKLVEAENKIDVAKVAVEELDKMSKLAEENELLMELAKEMHERCSRGEIVLLA